MVVTAGAIRYAKLSQTVTTSIPTPSARYKAKFALFSALGVCLVYIK